MRRSKAHLEKLLEERDKLLAAHSELKPLQIEIEKKLDKAGQDLRKRSETLVKTMRDKVSNHSSLAYDEVNNVLNTLHSLKTKRAKRGEK